MSSSASNEHRGQCVRLAAHASWRSSCRWGSSSSCRQTTATTLGMSDGLTSVVLSTVWPGYSSMSPDEQAAVVESLQLPVRKAGHFSVCRVGSARLRDTSPGSGASVFPGDSITRKIAPAAAGAVVIAFVYACFDEFHQLFVAGRSGQPFDVGVDIAGAFVAVAIAVVVVRARERHHVSAVLRCFRHRCDMLLSICFVNRCFPKASS